MPRFVVLMSTYNGEKYLSEQIESILNQTIEDFCLMIHDDGSSDSTLKIIKKYSEMDSRIKLHFSDKQGYPMCFYNLLKNAPNASYYAFSDQDDIWLKNKLEAAYIKLKDKSGPLLYACKRYIVNSDANKILWEDEAPSLSLAEVFLKQNRAGGNTMVMNNEFREICLKYNPKFAPFHDAYYFRLSILFNGFIYDERPYILYRQHNTNASGMEVFGWRLFLKRISSLKAKNFSEKSNIYLYAHDLYEGYKDELDNEKNQILYAIKHQEKIKSKFLLLIKYHMGFSPIYEYLWKMMNIVLGRL